MVYIFVKCDDLIYVFLSQLWYAHRPPEDEHFRGRTYSTSDVHDSILPESMKLHVGVNSNGDVDVGDINLSEMDPEDIRVRIYTRVLALGTLRAQILTDMNLSPSWNRKDLRC